MFNKIQYSFSAQIWQYSTPKGGWFFVTLPLEISKEIRENLKWQEEGWGRLKATAQIGSTKWDTAIWFDTKQNSYLLPLKSAVRKSENLCVGNNIEVFIYV